MQGVDKCPRLAYYMRTKGKGVFKSNLEVSLSLFCVKNEQHIRPMVSLMLLHYGIIALLFAKSISEWGGTQT